MYIFMGISELSSKRCVVEAYRLNVRDNDGATGIVEYSLNDNVHRV